MRLLFYGESPLHATGFGYVNRHLLAACAQEADVVCIASGHYDAAYEWAEFPYTIIGCPDVPLEARTIEEQRNRPRIMAALDALDWDVFFYQGDMGWNNDVLEHAAKLQEAHPEKDTIFYMPIDGDTALPGAFSIFSHCSVPVVYTNHAKSVIARYQPDLADLMSVVWLGCEPDVFHPLSQEERKAARLRLFGEAYQDRFLVLNVARNQQRKDLLRCMAAWHLFHKQHQDSTLILHSMVNDVGGNLAYQAMLVGCDVHKRPAEIAFTNLDLAHPWTREDLNLLYNACDCLVSTAYGEGWGLATSEAMAAGLPVAVPYNTANLDLLGTPLRHPVHTDSIMCERGFGIRTGGDLDHTTYLYTNGNSVCSTIHTQSFLDTLDYVYRHREEARLAAWCAREWTEENTWKRREGEWQTLLQIIKTRQARSLSTSRNDQHDSISASTMTS